MTRDEPTVTLVRTDTVPEGARVRHYDELGEPAQRLLAAAENGERAAGSAPGLADGDVVVYTDYYRIERASERVLG